MKMQITNWTSTFEFLELFSQLMNLEYYFYRNWTNLTDRINQIFTICLIITSRWWIVLRSMFTISLSVPIQLVTIINPSNFNSRNGAQFKYWTFLLILIHKIRGLLVTISLRIKSWNLLSKLTSFVAV